MSARTLKADTNTPEDVFAFAKEQGAVMVDVRFTDLLGTWHHFTMPLHQLTPETFERGFAFDGSSVRGWKSIEASDMSVVPDPTSAFLDPFTEEPTLVLVGDVHDPITGQDYERDPRSVARRAEAYLRSTGVADTAYFGPEAEFFILDEVRFRNDPHEAGYAVDSVVGAWNTGREEYPNLGYKVRPKGGYVPVPPTDALHDLRTEMCRVLESVGIEVERHHMEVASGGQTEIDFRFDSLLRQADRLNLFKYVVRNVARARNKTVTFMPKPIFGDNGNGMHTHMSLWKEGKPLFGGDAYAGLSDLALHFVAGILHHGPALCAFTNPTTNSYKRLVPGFEAPVRLAYSGRNRSAALRVPAEAARSPKAARVEFRTPDAMANPYLAFPALLMAGLDGIARRLDPGEPLDRDIYNLSAEELADVPKAPATLAEALDALERDHGFLLEGGVFTRDILRAWIDWKRTNEVLEVGRRPHPYEFLLYFDA